MKKILAMVISIALVATMAITGSIAYLQDTDEAINVMTMGNVFIEQYEQERKTTVNADGTENYLAELQEFTQGQDMYPAVYINGQKKEAVTVGEYTVQIRDESVQNYVDKIVTVENTGDSNAYVRTIIAVPEAGDFDTTWDASEQWFHWNGVSDTDTNPANGWIWGKDKTTEWPANTDNWDWVNNVKITVNGVEGVYDLYVATNKNILEPGKTTAPSLVGFYVDKAVDNEKDADGNLYYTFGNYNLGDITKLNVLVATQAVQADGFTDAWTALDAAFDPISATNHPWVDEVTNAPILVTTAAELQAALDSAENGATIVLADDITGDVTVTQKPNTKFTIDGAHHNYAGVITVDGKSATYTTAGLTIKNVNFKADSISADACIRLGDGTNATRYTCNVTVSNCTFDVPGAVGVKSYTGGDKKLTIAGCTATSNCHSLVQAKGIDGILVEGCKVYSKNGLNFNNSTNVTVDGCTVDVKGYAVRFGESSGGVGAAEIYAIKNCTLKSANEGGDATIILRGTADNATLTIEETTITGDPDITNTATGATVVR